LLLIGFDFDRADRLEGESVSESTNYLTGLRIVKRTGKRETISRTQVPKMRLSLEEVDGDKFEEDAVNRLNFE